MRPIAGLLVLFCVSILDKRLLLGAASEVCKVDSRRINDNYCDCPQTSEDETTTSACSPIGKFKCADRDVFIPTSRVSDGVCDCCDGSDEPLGACSNTCAEIDRLERIKQQELEERKREGERGFMELLQKAKQSCAEATKPSDSVSLEEKKSLQDELEKAESDLMKLEEEMGEESSTQRADALHLSKLSREDLEELIVELAVQTKSGLTLERLVAEKLTCSTAGKVTEEDEASPYGESEGSSPDSEDDVQEDACDPVWIESPAPPNPDLQSAKEKARVLRENWESKFGKDDVTDDSNRITDFGPAQVWRALKDECFSLKKEQYTYQICIFGEFKQDHTRMGRFSKWSNDYKEQMYDEGDRCYSPSIARSVKVRLECGAANALVDVFEPSTCVYEAVFTTPASCIPDNVASLLAEECAAVSS